MSAEFDTMTAAELRRRIDVSPVELTQRAIDKAQASPATLNVFPMPIPMPPTTSSRPKSVQKSTNREITCRTCGGPLPGRDGNFVIKYFPLRKAGRTQRRH